MNPKEIKISDFTYELPDERIARFPLAERDQSKLLVFKNGNIEHRRFFELPDYLQSGDVLLINNTKVVQARLFFQTESDKKIEIFCLEPVGCDIQQAMMHHQTSDWLVLIGGAKKWNTKEILILEVNYQNTTELRVQFIERANDGFIVRFLWDGDSVFADILNAAGKMPLPPYLKREPDENDKTRYQTVYAAHEGSVAAPTAGLHFTDRVFEAIAKKGIDKKEIILHVGAGTFRPVKSDTMSDHEMHAEEIIADLDLICFFASNKNRVIAVGTTSCRSIESIYWLGVQLLNGIMPKENLLCGQWTPYEIQSENISANDAFSAVVEYMNQKKMKTLKGQTALMIAPGYTYRVISAIITNFHQPNSTLLLLVAAGIGNNWKKVYTEALKNDYRFLSYGDSSLLFLNA
jgi:S-adenosylmethionine:tRNA ribosyltransferase-isomerase